MSEESLNSGKALMKYAELDVESNWDKVLILRDVVRKLETQLAESQKQVQELVQTLEIIAKTDISENAPDFMWLNNWRNSTKTFAQNVLLKHKLKGNP